MQPAALRVEVRANLELQQVTGIELRGRWKAGGGEGVRGVEEGILRAVSEALGGVRRAS